MSLPFTYTNERTPPPVIAIPLRGAIQATGTNRSRMLEAVKRGKLQARKAGNRLLFEPSELQRWVRSLPVHGRQDAPTSAVEATL
jgi:hypothetical protein